MTQRQKIPLKKHHHHTIDDDNEHQQLILNEAKNFLQSLEALRNEIITRDETYKTAKKNGSKEQMAQYHQLASAISQKCLDYGRNLCDAPIPYWVDGDLSREKIEIARHAYDVIRNKLCASLDVFDNDLLPNARALITFAEGRF